MGRFQYGVCEWSLKARGRELCRVAAEHKLDCLQLGVGEEVLDGKGLGSPAVIEAYRQGSAEYGVEICSLSPQFVDQYSFTMPQGAEEERIAAELVDRTIDLCGEFGCKSFLLPVLGKNGICDGRPSTGRRRISDGSAKKPRRRGSRPIWRSTIAWSRSTTSWTRWITRWSRSSLIRRTSMCMTERPWRGILQRWPT